MTSRRDVITGAGAALALGACPETVRAATLAPSLHDLAAAKGLIFGSATGLGAAGSLSGSQRDPAYRALLIRECGALVCENEMKWYSLRPTEAEFAFGRADEIARFAATHGMALRGHTLLWHHPDWFPGWLTGRDFGPAPAREAERLLTEHTDRVCARYPQVFSWDVVNEAVDPETGALRETSLSRAMGPAVLDVAFHAARAAAPNAQLVYNDYMSWEAGHETHRAGVLRLLEGFRSRGVPIDALGVQSHIGSGNTDSSTGFDTAREAPWRRFLDEVTGMGLDLVVTEFDVHDKNLPADIASRDAAVADLGERYLDLMLDYPQTRAVMCWGLCDRYSWLQNLWPRADKAGKRPTPYDTGYRTKPLRAAIARAFAAAPTRSALDTASSSRK
jgi:endo-1,4-beta-xylanase